MKIFLSLMLSAFMLFGEVGCDMPNQQIHKSYEEQKALYDGIISEYTSLLSDKYNGKELSTPDIANMDEREASIFETLYGIVDSCKTAENLGYGYKDLDDNGTPELILLTKYASIQAVFTISEDLPILLEAAYEPGNVFLIIDGNKFSLLRSTVTDNIEEGIQTICHVDGDKMVYDTIYGAVYDRGNRTIVERFQEVNGTRVPIDEDTYRSLNREYQKITTNTDMTIIKLEAPYIHLPLAESKPDSNLPIADFSSYEAIRNTYIAISGCLETFNSTNWVHGNYDNLFTFPSDVSYEYYNQFLYMAYYNNQPLGFDEIDLNGDGTDELVLITEDYRIKAIFTQRDGVPKLLDVFVHSYQTCWLDGDGLIHVDSEDYYELVYGLYEFTKDGEYKHHYSIICDNYGRYLMKNGINELITFDESIDIFYNDYVRYSGPFPANEFTRNVSGFTYTPIAEISEDNIKTATEKTWHKYVDLEKSSDKDFARSNTYVTFENVTDTKMDMNLKYEFIFSYPDPDRENYLLDEVEEDTLEFFVKKENDNFVFEGNGIQGKLEFGQKFLWVIVENSSDERFPVGNYCHKIYSPKAIIQ